MNFLDSFNQKIKKWQAEEKASADRQAERDLARAQSKAERKRILDDLKHEELVRQKKVEEARTAALKAEAARRRAAKEVKDLGGGGILNELTKMFGPTKKTVRRKNSRRRK